MALPKRQHSVQRGRKRRTHWKAKAASLMPCPNCKKPTLTHRVCPYCGFYKGKMIVAPKIKKEKKEKQ